jgi:hypothetical protein
MGPNEPVSLKGGVDTRLRVAVTGARPGQVKHYSLSAQQLASTLLASLDDIQTVVARCQRSTRTIGVCLKIYCI